MRLKKWNNSITVVVVTFCVTGLFQYCSVEDNNDYFPKPFGFSRIDMPKVVKWNKYDTIGCPFTFLYPDYGYSINNNQSCNQTIIFPFFKAALYSTYIQLDNINEKNNLYTHSEYSRNLVYEHTIKADEIIQNVISNDTNKVYGVSYEIIGNVASNYQFFITDSIKHFYRASLYFESSPNIDSLQPALDYLKFDINKIIQSFKWKN